MKNGILVLLTILMVCSCGKKKESGAKAPLRVKTQMVSPAFADDAQTYVGIVEEREGTAVSFTSMGPRRSPRDRRRNRRPPSRSDTSSERSRRGR